jgi:putative hydrolase of the HAD superfamily
LKKQTVWLFDLDNTLHDARAIFRSISAAMTDYIEEHLAVDRTEANRLRSVYWERYGATLPGLTRHHGVSAAHFLHETHVLPDLEARVRWHAGDLALLQRLPGRKILLTNAPEAYARRVLRSLGNLGMGHVFEQVIAFEQMRMFGQHRSKPDARMLRHVLARHRLRATDCVLVEDTLIHQKSARALGIKTVWMQRWLLDTRGARHGPEASSLLRRRPVYVSRRVRSLKSLLSGGF